MCCKFTWSMVEKSNNLNTYMYVWISYHIEQTWTNNMIISCSTKKMKPWNVHFFFSSTCFWVFRSKPPNIQCQSTCRNASRAALAIFFGTQKMSSVNAMARRNLESSPPLGSFLEGQWCINNFGAQNVSRFFLRSQLPSKTKSLRVSDGEKYLHGK